MLDKNIIIKFHEGALSPQFLETTCQESFGASTSFQGTVRKYNLGRVVRELSYDLHQRMAYKALYTIAQEALDKWEENACIEIRHSYGKLQVGAISVIIVVYSPHRHEAFEMCRFVIEELKKRAPIWKKEIYEDGESAWVKGHALCRHSKRSSEQREDH